ncbi:hypothetical protein HGRIS_008111 [Hohenbuehelia grisea]|uniref:Chromatin remodeling factor mit1 n=1 Tax=Hohenbuehelia grisea TaxID=104357 RepID=A0ABR3J6Z2_9AGAR
MSRKPTEEPSDFDMEVVPDSEEEEELEAEEEEYATDSSAPARRSQRKSAKSANTLPYSPRKTRSQKLYLATTTDAEDDAESEDDRPRRRSTRTRNVVKMKLDGDSYAGDSDADDDDDDDEVYLSTRKSKDKKPKPKRKKAPRPAYGHIHSIEDLDYDAYSDEDTAPLREHRSLCERCLREPSHLLLAAFDKRQKNRKRKRKHEDDDLEDSGDERDKIVALGGWIRCLKCPVSYHWNCLARNQRDEILIATRDRDRDEWRSRQPHDEVYDENGQPKPHPDEPKKRKELQNNEITEFICAPCLKGGICMYCLETALAPDATVNGTSAALQPSGTPAEAGDVEMADGTSGEVVVNGVPPESDEPPQLLFRCLTCKRLAHYKDLPPNPDLGPSASIGDLARDYQMDGWLCLDCLDCNGRKVDHILAWRPYPANAVETTSAHGELVNYKSHLPREYLVKWVERSYKRSSWVQHMWLLSTHPGKLRNFVQDGPKIELLPEPIVDASSMVVDEENPAAPTFQSTAPSRESSVNPRSHTPSLGRGPLVDAEKRIPPAWKTVDRVLDVRLWNPRTPKRSNKPGKGKGKASRIDSEESSEEEDNFEHAQFKKAFEEGTEPDNVFLETIPDWEKRTGQQFGLEHLQHVVWIFAKWDDLNYDDSTWDSPPRPEDPTYTAFQSAIERYLKARKVRVSNSAPAEPDRKVADFNVDGFFKYRLKDGGGLDLGQSEKLKLMDFQVEGFNWLCNNWWKLQHCILADEMGLGKTVQVTSFLGHIIKTFDASPALVVVPNSTITNWIREFERWAPNLRVVPWYGEAKARDIIRDYELYHDTHHSGFSNVKFHVLVTTFEAVINPKDFGTIFKKQPRWEVLVVDEGQRLKSDSSLIFRKLKELNTIHRVIMTGTPLNNNIRELFNLMNFLDPGQWKDLQGLEKEYETLTEDLVKQLHTRLRPYFLRRIKSEVLQLPPKNEVIVPVSMAPLQKRIYKSILSHNLDLLKGLTTQPLSNMAPRKTKLNNVLMEVRKCLQHPYLYAEDIEPRGLPLSETHEKLIDASGKFRLLKQLLPKLKARGHRVLLFSQFVIALNIIEDFLYGEGIKFLRLDGSTKGRDRQKGMDEFNRPGSDVFIYLLSTRAGGVGINLFSADTVIIFDPDFNPHQDLQAIARAHRFGQQKTVLVFKLMVKDSAEERIMQVGKKKLVLDHLIVQKMEDEEGPGEDVQSILTYGAKALFEEEAGSSRDIVYTDNDLDKLIVKTETDVPEPATANQEGGFTFSFAKIWAADKDALEEVEEANEQDDAWAQTLQKIAEEREKAQVVEAAQSGRGTRRRAAIMRPNAYIDQTPTKLKRTKSDASDGSAYDISEFESDDQSATSHISSVSNDFAALLPGQLPEHTAGQPIKVKVPKPRKPRQRKSRGSTPRSVTWFNSDDEQPEHCGLCGQAHGAQEGDCPMTQKSEFLVEFRRILITSEDEPLEQRRMAIQAIDETLYQRGEVHLINGQPLFLVEEMPRFPVNPGPRNSPPEELFSRAYGNSENGTDGNTSHAPQARSNATNGHGSSHRAHAQSSNAGASSSKQKLPLHPSSGLSDLDSMPVPSFMASAAPVAGPSKRPASPLENPIQRKKSRESLDPKCPVCQRSPYHLIKDCPVVAMGPSSVAREIARLDQDPKMSDAVIVLRKVLKKQKKRELEAQMLQMGP